jgi:hypothetical protein
LDWTYPGEKNCLLHEAIEGLIPEEKGVGRITELFDDLSNRRTYREIKEEAKY